MALRHTSIVLDEGGKISFAAEGVYPPNFRVGAISHCFAFGSVEGVFESGNLMSEVGV